MKNFLPIQFRESKLHLLDQRKLPNEELFVICNNIEETHHAIRDMVVRGAPCIGFTAIYGIALWLKNNVYEKKKFIEACDFLISARPTAVNLEYEVQKVKEMVLKVEDKTNVFKFLVDHANKEIEFSESKNLQMAKFAADELERRYSNKKLKLLTHCNTGFLACGSLGTALGVIEYLNQLGRIEKVWVDETRPYLQGSRLTSYELTKLNIPHEIVVEGAATFLMENQMVDAIFVGADRIVSNGDTANKIGTANLSIISKYFKVPMYTVAPLSSFDFNSSSGKSIEIELRNENEILEMGNHRIAPIAAKAFNPSFDITRGENLEGIICEKGLFRMPYVDSLKGLI